MDKITDFFKEIKDRISNPFLSSFIITWLGFNWRIIAALFTFSKEDYKVLGCLNFIDFAETQIDTSKNFTYPILVALVYTFAFPFFRNFVLRTNAWFKRWGSNWVRDASRGGMIAMNKYISQRETYEENTEILMRLIDEESKISIQNSSLKTKIKVLEQNLNNQKLEYENYLTVSGTLIKQLESEVSLAKQKIISNEIEIQNLHNNQDCKSIYGLWFIENNTKHKSSQEPYYRIHMRYIERIENEAVVANEFIQLFLKQPNNNKVQFCTRETESQINHFYDLNIQEDGTMKGNKDRQPITFRQKQHS